MKICGIISDPSDEKCLHEEASTKGSIIFLFSICLDPLEQTTVTWQHFIHEIFFDGHFTYHMMAIQMIYK